MSEAVEPRIPRWGTQDRDRKGLQILSVLERALNPGENPADAIGCDLGCGNGVIGATLAPHVKKLIAVDREPWPTWPQLESQHPNLSFLPESATAVPLPDGFADFVVCNQVYEHVDDPVALIESLRRLLKPGGICYFAGPNLLFPIEPHVIWPFVHWLPRRFAVGLMKLMGSKGELDAYSTHYWRLLRWFHGFSVENVLPFVVHERLRAVRPRWLGAALSRIPDRLIRWATPLSPGFVFILRKPRTP